MAPQADVRLTNALNSIVEGRLTPHNTEVYRPAVYVLNCTPAVPDIRSAALKRGWVLDYSCARDMEKWSVVEYSNVPIQALRIKANRDCYYVHHSGYRWAYPLWVELTQTASTLYYVGYSETPVKRIHTHLKGLSDINFLDIMNITGVEAVYPCDQGESRQLEEQVANERTIKDSDTVHVNLDDVTSFAYWA